jgi:hypothetical protein
MISGPLSLPFLAECGYTQSLGDRGEGSPEVM